CNPRNEAGNNDVPSRIEILNCSSFLKRTIEVVNPILVIALGRVALESLRLIERHDFDLRGSTGKIKSWAGRNLGVLYHPGPRTVVHRSWQKQLADARRLAKLAGELPGAG